MRPFPWIQVTLLSAGVVGLVGVGGYFLGHTVETQAPAVAVNNVSVEKTDVPRLAGGTTPVAAAADPVVVAPAPAPARNRPDLAEVIGRLKNAPLSRAEEEYIHFLKEKHIRVAPAWKGYLLLSKEGLELGDDEYAVLKSQFLKQMRANPEEARQSLASTLAWAGDRPETRSIRESAYVLSQELKASDPQLLQSSEKDLRELSRSQETLTSDDSVFALAAAVAYTRSLKEGRRTLSPQMAAVFENLGNRDRLLKDFLQTELHGRQPSGR